MTTCTRCEGSGFLNLHQVDDETLGKAQQTTDFLESDKILLDWVKQHPDSDVQVCTCCGNGEEWYGIPGEHYNDEDPPGPDGPYAYNGGLCECD